MDKILVFLPTLNEFGSAAKILGQLQNKLPGVDFLIVDDGSIDGTITEIRQLDFANLELLSRPNRMGVGRAHIDALLYGKEKGYDFLISMDADGTHRVDDVVRICEKRNESNLIIGSRFASGASMVKWPLSRILLSKSAHFVTRVGLGLPYDCSSGLRSYSLNSIPTKLIRYLRVEKVFGYDYFFKSLFLFSSYGLSIIDFPVTLEPRMLGKSKMNLFEASRSVFSLFYEVIYFRFAATRSVFLKSRNMYEET